MKNKYFPKSLWMGVALGLVSLLWGSTALASHHFDTEISRELPAFDATDAYVFESERPGHTVFVMCVNPHVMKDENPFAANGLYNLHIAFGNKVTEGVTYTVKFSGAEFEFGKLDTPNGPVGKKGEKIGNGNINQPLTLDNGMRMWAGVAEDPFAGNGAGLANFKAALDAGIFDLSTFDNAEDLFKGHLVGAIVLEVPNDLLGAEVHYCMSTAANLKSFTLKNGRKIPDGWQQINRAANVLLLHLFFGQNLSESKRSRDFLGQKSSTWTDGERQ